MTKLLQRLLAKKEALLKECDAITENPLGEGEGDDIELSAEQREQLDAKLEKLKTINADIEREREIIDQRRNAPTLELNDVPIEGGEPVIKKDPKFGFEEFGEFCAAVVYAGKHPRGDIDERLRIVAAAPTTYGSEGVGEDGGFLVPPEFGQQIFMLSLEQQAILPMTDNQQISRNSITYPKDETTPWGTDGIQVYWENEANAPTQTKPKLGYTTHRLHKLIGLVPLTDELLEDAPAMASFVQEGLAKRMRWKFNDAFVNGNGNGQPLGIANADALVAVPKITSTSPDQAADTVLVGNIADMFARMPGDNLQNAIWMIQNDVLPQLVTMVLNDQPIFTAPGGLPNAPAGALLGRPIMITQHCQTLGDQGDIYFVDWSEYRSITKRGGIQTATSMHLFFDADSTAFRATFRVDGQPKLSAPISPARGSNNLSPFVTLAARA